MGTTPIPVDGRYFGFRLQTTNKIRVCLPIDSFDLWSPSNPAETTNPPGWRLKKHVFPKLLEKTPGLTVFFFGKALNHPASEEFYLDLMAEQPVASASLVILSNEAGPTADRLG